MSKVRAKTDEGAGAAPGPAAALRTGRPLPPTLSIPPPPRVAGRPVPTQVPIATEDDEEATPSRALLKVALATAAAVAAFFAINQMTGEAPAPARASPRSGQIAKQAQDQGPATPTIDGAGSQLSPADVAFLNTLTARLNRDKTAPTEAEIEQVEAILLKDRANEQLKGLMMSLYLARAHKDLELASHDLVETTLVKMKLLDDADPEVHLFESHARAKSGDWEGVLAAAEKYEGLAASTPRISYAIAVALEKLGRRPDAIGVLGRPIFQTCPQATNPSDASACRAAEEMRQALASLMAAAGADTGAGAIRERAALAVDASKNQIQSEMFDIRFDGENQTGVARDVLFVLNRAYTRLADIYYDRPRRKIPVVLHSQQDYYSKTGAPWWSGGVYSSHNGAIQIPIRGMPSTLPREMEDTLVHELSHAFVDEMAGGWAGRELQEGLAQYMEGKRIETEMKAADLKKLANSSGASVGAVYMNALVFVQVLVQSRGQGMVNQLLQSMKEAGSEEGGFKKTFGQSGEAMKREIFDTFKRRYS